ncbi:hypothetical protein HAP48_0042580 [Bradyrhizobium septentrionale]|uniref:Lipoprotein n=1 Tax=Bradyrhizobium septentrionale TaxID=1404411 RepID=A0A973W2T6_9BRAD|nr:hypothetical protein [Bradyrhizobium septentrionale]UGY15146.1 hypothetical protein HAP48_0042580 [Bradyrhizobium septentrionale]
MTRTFMLLGALLLAGCGIDRGQCLADHEETSTWMMPVQTGSISCGNGCTMPIYTHIPIEDHHRTCDRWEFPEGRPQ